MAFRSRRTRSAHPGGGHDLDIMPMLNVFMAIIPLLLLSAAFIPVTVIQASLPGEASAASATAAPEEPALDLTIQIRPGRWLVEANGHVPSSIPRPPAGAHNVAREEEARTRLAAALEAIVKQHPDHRQVRIAAEPGTRYEDIVDVMDLARAAGLPEAALADAVMGGS